MKIIVSIPLVLAIGLLSSSCGSSSKEEPVINRPIPAPPSLPDNPVLDEQQPVAFSQTAIPIKSAIPVASRVAGRPGFVFNPYNQNMVEVNGIASGTKCRDPQDPNPNHVFVIP